MSGTKTKRATIIPALRYRDATAAIDWLCRHFGFEKHTVFADDKGAVMHAELIVGNGMIMIGPVADTPFGRFMEQPDAIGRRRPRRPSCSSPTRTPTMPRRWPAAPRFSCRCATKATAAGNIRAAT